MLILYRDNIYKLKVTPYAVNNKCETLWIKLDMQEKISLHLPVQHLE